MTTEELRKFFDDNFGLNPRPGMYLVDIETYANVCQSIFEAAFDKYDIQWSTDGGRSIEIWLGPNKGIMFKKIELIIGNRIPLKGANNDSKT